MFSTIFILSIANSIVLLGIIIILVQLSNKFTKHIDDFYPMYEYDSDIESYCAESNNTNINTRTNAHNYINDLLNNVDDSEIMPSGVEVITNGEEARTII